MGEFILLMIVSLNMQKNTKIKHAIICFFLFDCIIIINENAFVTHKYK